MNDRRQILFRQEALRRSLERALRGRMQRELKYTAKAAGESYPSWENAIAGHILRVGTILEQFYLKALESSSRMMNQAVIKAGLELEVKAKKKTSDNLGNAMRQWARTQAVSKVTEIGKTTRDRIKRAIDKGLEKGLAENEIGKEIVRMTGGAIASSRALTIARTESHGAAQAGGLMAAKDLGVVQTKEWISAEDERTRETHADADGQTVGIDDTFTVGDDELSFPGDPSGSAEEVINCRCVVAYGVQPLQEQTQSQSNEEQDVE